MTTAFQANAFQFGAFQIDVTVSSYGGRRHTAAGLKKARAALRAAERAEDKLAERRKSVLLNLVQRKGAPSQQRIEAKAEIVQIEKAQQLPPAARYGANEKIARLRAAASAAEAEHDRILAAAEARAVQNRDDMAIVILLFA